MSTSNSPRTGSFVISTSLVETQETAEVSFDSIQIGKHERTLGGNITNAIRNAIISGKLAPGQSLGQEFLANLFNVSRVPIRECLKQLATEGLVELEPHKGAVVAKLSLKELDELYDILWALEMMAVRIGVGKLTDADIAQMAAMDAKLQVIDDPLEWYYESVRFHRVIVVAADMPRCLHMIDECRQNIGRYLSDASFFQAHVSEWNKRNRVLFRACQARDADKAVNALDVMRRLSTKQIRSHLVESLQKEGDPASTPRKTQRVS
ncbi:GntR family transcriptional regulator [Paucibacter sp. R3-3]|uniref:GntR family transcriptional regulator n=1 Tax=Roseateles agri TaxID=3098619 RepID=A0ABU5DP29_9BURK|nr:GntR family transcriptional regulator [Paucibacter sp. R3-3]MDY0748048.1 GntR family transcriptional regulator [Paucibacter sp. R3-3]